MAMNVINQPIGATVKFNVIVKSTNMEGFVRGTILFQWPWRCTEHPNMIWIISLRSVPIFSTIDNRKVIYSFFFTFNFFLQHVGITLNNMF
jgi:hypothetical protein